MNKTVQVKVATRCWIIIATLGFIGLATLPLLGIVIVLMLAPVAYAVVFWVRVLDARDIQHQ